MRRSGPGGSAAEGELARETAGAEVAAGTRSRVVQRYGGAGEAIEGFRDDPEGLRDLVTNLPEASYEAYLAGLSEGERQAQGELLQLIELMRTSGMTVEELADEQRRFLEGEAARQGMTVGEYINDRVDRRGYGGSPATWWPSLTDAEKADWRRRFREAVAAVRSAATPDVARVIADAEGRGGGIRFEPELSEQLGAFGFTRGDWSLYVGRRWIETAESDPTSVFANIVHEMGGHNEYGGEIGGAVMDEVLADLPQDERDRATASGNSVFSAYGYMETEIWAELREHEHDDERNPSDHPTGDVPNQLNQIRVAFAPAVAEALVRSMWRRILLDSRITDSARDLFRENVRLVFEIDLSDS
jgi:hypothetical protein